MTLWHMQLDQIWCYFGEYYTKMVFACVLETSQDAKTYKMIDRKLKINKDVSTLYHVPFLTINIVLPLRWPSFQAYELSLKIHVFVCWILCLYFGEETI